VNHQWEHIDAIYHKAQPLIIGGAIKKKKINQEKKNFPSITGFRRHEI